VFWLRIKSSWVRLSWDRGRRRWMLQERGWLVKHCWDRWLHNRDCLHGSWNSGRKNLLTTSNLILSEPFIGELRRNIIFIRGIVTMVEKEIVPNFWIKRTIPGKDCSKEFVINDMELGRNKASS
jgi:hypothetical protein